MEETTFWDATAKVSQMHSQLRSSQGEISALESFLLSRETRCESVAQIVSLQNKLSKAQEKITSLK